MPSRRPDLIQYDVEFYVRWDASTRRFNIERGNVATGRCGVNKGSAVALATRAAQFEHREGKTAAVYSFNGDGKRVVEWSA